MYVQVPSREQKDSRWAVVGGEEFRVPPLPAALLSFLPRREGILGISSSNHLTSTLWIHRGPATSIELVYSLSCGTKIFSFFIQKISGDDGDRLVLGVHAHFRSYLGIRSRGSSASAPFPPDWILVSSSKNYPRYEETWPTESFCFELLSWRTAAPHEIIPFSFHFSKNCTVRH